MPALTDSRIYKWVDERFKINDLVDYLSQKGVPQHRHYIFYYFGGISLFLFIVQVITGILLLMYYRPGADTAYESVQFIVANVSFGWLIRALHSWSANLMVFAVFVHMFSVYFTSAYRKPRELTWLTGMGLLGLALAFGFSGYLLPWNELAFFATRVGTGMAGALPVIGDDILIVMRGGEEVTGATIGRFFGLHVAILPGLFTVLLAAHLVFIQRQGMSEPLGWQNTTAAGRKMEKFFPNFLLKDLLVWLIVLNVLAVLAVFFPDGIGAVHWPLGVKADPFAPPPEVIRPEWYFMFAFQALKLLPAHVGFVEGELFGIMVFGLGGLVWTLVPFLDRKSHTGEINRLFYAFGWLVLAFILVMTVMGYFWE
ncbi:MAG: cytochrome b N-terminal domain-containing protein [candidate division Zixibacteria bacterium]|nr:cytochrome b N-terminal domain-containing protein [candidate division Zixibacteria bacterium]